MAITALPTPPNSVTDTRTVFQSRADALLGALPTFVNEANALETNVNNKEASAVAQVALATTQANNAAASATTAGNTAGAAAWVAATNYAVNACAISQVNFQTYRCKVAGVDATDPANNSTKWTRVLGSQYNIKTAIAASAIDLALGDYFTKTIAGNTTFTLSNVPAAGLAASFILDLTNGGAYAVTWWAGVKWANGSVPALTAAGRDAIGFYTHDGGTTWTGLILGKDIK
jgi:hypothetical protein